jgi:MYXO-CTERM domain-containing protein
MKVKFFLGAIALISISSHAHAAAINVGILGPFNDGTNNWPGAEPPEAAIDGAGQKYLNFAEFNTGVIVTPGSSTATSMTLTTANDAPERDPANYVLMGSNASFIGSGPFDTADFTLISSGGLALPLTRNAGGLVTLDPANQQTVSFSNSTAYSSYLIYFPTVRDPAAANSMQIAEIQLQDGAGAPIFSPQNEILGVQVVPEPSAGLLALLALGGLGLRRRRK